jgi:hypothetical protein
MSKPVTKKPGGKAVSLGTIALIAPVLVILVASLWLAVRTWLSSAGSPMSTNGYVAMALGIVFSTVLGCGLMALLFYSSRHGYDDIGYDEPHRPDNDRD